MIWRSGTVRFFTDAFPKGPKQNPSRSFVLGNPVSDVGVGCVIDLVGADTIGPGSAGAARIGLVDSEDAAAIVAPIDIWYGRAVGVIESFEAP